MANTYTYTTERGTEIAIGYTYKPTTICLNGGEKCDILQVKDGMVTFKMAGKLVAVAVHPQILAKFYEAPARVKKSSGYVDDYGDIEAVRKGF